MCRPSLSGSCHRNPPGEWPVCDQARLTGARTPLIRSQSPRNVRGGGVPATAVSTYSCSRWSVPAARRSLFAIALGVVTQAASARVEPLAVGSLIAALVARAPRSSSVEALPFLQELAIHTMDDGGAAVRASEIGDEAALRQALESRLIESEAVGCRSLCRYCRVVCERGSPVQ